ncbi:hypothetical protein B0T26DRAFT_754948 [Lasiosphaeria miniovina]|uniref:DUF21-domain-containing protein n=1 Tax=Lasiosphaeria miniovina TaxID=1954250 RepID=A0AA40A5W0_9PEZI|nr:uncharacterized protein B0T26DRAFT_754948 [Lasiosphaeria miniovina]KAK0709795.1 hypothetical protein B0T26DRAFT_754948 [Lasiosphaeria miniovina]
MKTSTSAAPHRATSTYPSGLFAARSAVVGLARVLFMGVSTAYAAPLTTFEHYHDDEPEEVGASLWVLYVASLVLVLLGGAFAGLTIALMGQDGIYLQVMARDPTEPQHRNAGRVFELLQRGKHWVLVTLLLSNVIVNETLPVVLDRCLGGGVAAVVGSTFLIVIFGEVLPQSVCVRYGLQIGGYMSKPVLALMYLMAPIAWPTAKLLDKLLGEDHGTVYKKSGLKTLVTLHKSLGHVSDRLNQDEVTIISAVLDLKEKPVASVMTPMEDVFVMAEDTVLDEQTMDMILSAGYSRIPIFEAGSPTNFVGMLLVKILITYDPEDGKLVRDFPLATLPETRPETSCLDIVNFFQEGKSHMVLVSEYPGEDHGAIGVVTLEDVIEELIGEEIIDESDVYIDVHKAIRRLTPAPKARMLRRPSEDQSPKLIDDSAVVVDGANRTGGHDFQRKSADLVGGTPDPSVLSSSPRATTFMMRRSSAGADGLPVRTTIPVRANFEEIKQHLRHLGPSNPATNPKNTRSTTVKVKPGLVVGYQQTPPRPASFAEGVIDTSIDEGHEQEEDETTNLLGAQFKGKDGIQALSQTTYGSVSPPSAEQHPSPKLPEIMPSLLETKHEEPSKVPDTATQTPSKRAQVDGSPEASGPAHSSGSNSDTGSRPELHLVPKRASVRSGSITENVIESRGVRKVILETTSSNDDDDVAVIGSSPEHSRSQSKITGFFGKAPVLEAEEEEEEEVTSPTGALSTSELSTAGGSTTGAKSGGGSGSASGSKKKTRRKKRKGGKS